MGSNTNEGALWVLSSFGTKAPALKHSDYDFFLTYNFGPLASKVNETYPLDRAFNGSVAAALTVIMTETTYKCPAYRGLLRASTKGVPVWSYHFAHTPGCPWYASIPAKYLSVLGATHTSEIPFVFNMTSNMPPPDGTCTFSGSEQGISLTLSRAWTNMAEFGSPGDNDAWPSWTSNSSMGVTVKDAVEVAEIDYKTCAFWNEINDAVNKYAATQ